jgi:hypothetical protein
LLFFAGDGKYITFATQHPLAFSEPTITVDDATSSKIVYTYDAVRDVLILQSASNGQFIIAGTKGCSTGISSPGGRYAAINCGADILLRDVARARNDSNYQNIKINVNSTGGLWPDDCEPEDISPDGTIILLTCSRAASNPNSIFPNTTLFQEMTSGIVMVNLSSSNQRVHPVPLPWPQQGSTRAQNPRMPYAAVSDLFGAEFFISYNLVFLVGQNFTTIPILYYPSEGSSRFLAGQANGATFISGISERADFFAFSSAASNLVSYDANGNMDVFHFAVENNAYTLASASNPYCSYHFCVFGSPELTQPFRLRFATRYRVPRCPTTPSFHMPRNNVDPQPCVCKICHYHSRRHNYQRRSDSRAEWNYSGQRKY